MANGLICSFFEDGAFQEAAADVDNVEGSPVASFRGLYDGREIGDTYGVSFSSVVPGVSAVAEVAAASGTANPYHGRTQSVALDGSTEHDDLVPGIGLVFSSSVSFTSSWLARVQAGMDFGSMPAFAPDAGTPSPAIRVQVQNVGLDTCSVATVRLIARLKRVRKVGTVLDLMRPFAERATEKIHSGNHVVPYSLDASSVSGSGVSRIATLRADGALFGVQELVTQATGTSAGLNVVDQYLATDGPLRDMKFRVSQLVANGASENVLVFSPRFTQTAPDTPGPVPGTFGTSDFDIAESGLSAGISPGGFAYFWMRAVVPAGSVSRSNPYPLDVCVFGRTTAAAGWDDPIGS